MKFITNIGILFFVFLSYSACKNKEQILRNDLSKSNLKGNVESLTEFGYEAVDHFGEIKRKITIPDSCVSGFQETYDTTGNRVLIKKYNPDGTIWYRCEYFYLEGKLADEVESMGSDTTIYTYQYDKNGFLKKQLHRKVKNKAIELLGTNTYTCDEYGRVLTKSEGDEKINFVFFKYIYNYNEFGNLISEKSFHHDELGYERVVNYDANQYISEKKLITTSEAQGGIEKFQNDENGNVIIYERFDKKNVLKETKRYSYTYDNIGNWTEKVESINGNLKYIYVRTIKYF